MGSAAPGRTRRGCASPDVCAALSPQAFWNWVENYPDEFTMLYQRPQADMAGRTPPPPTRTSSNQTSVQLRCVCVCAEAAEKLFDLVDTFAESTKRKAAVWPLQTILLILCPEITHTISKDTVEDSKVNKVGRARTHPRTRARWLTRPLGSAETVPGQLAESSVGSGWQQTADGERRHRLRQALQSLHLHQLGGSLYYLPPGAVHRHGSEGLHLALGL